MSGCWGAETSSVSQRRNTDPEKPQASAAAQTCCESQPQTAGQLTRAATPHVAATATETTAVFATAERGTITETTGANIPKIRPPRIFRCYSYAGTKCTQHCGTFQEGVRELSCFILVFQQDGKRTTVQMVTSFAST